MRKTAEWIVGRRNQIFAGFMVLFVFCLFMIPRVEVENELTSYLAEDTETRQGLDLMEEQFVTLGTAKVMVDNIDFRAAQELADRLREIRGVSEVEFYEESDEEAEELGEVTDEEALRDVYRDLSALYSITFEGEEEEAAVQHAMAEIRDLLEDYDAWVYTTVDKDDSAELQREMGVILVIAVVIIVLVLWFTSGTYAEIPIFMLTFGMAAVLNMGTNFIFGTVSFITNAVGVVLQLALAIDYAIILFHPCADKRDPGDRLQFPDHDCRNGGADVHAVRYRDGPGKGDGKGDCYEHAFRVRVYAFPDYVWRTVYRKDDAQKLCSQDRRVGKTGRRCAESNAARFCVCGGAGYLAVGKLSVHI